LGQLVHSGSLGIAVSFGELPDKGDFVVDDCVLIESRPQDAVVFAAQDIDQGLQLARSDPTGSSPVWRSPVWRYAGWSSRRIDVRRLAQRFGHRT
jgi:hypothetical protein